MTSLIHPAPRFWFDHTPRASRDLVTVGASGHLAVRLAIGAVLACLLAGAILLVTAFGGIDTGGRIPHPVPLPAPTGQSLAGS